MILDLHRQGLSVSAIARELGLDRKTVRRHVERGLQTPVYGPRPQRPRLTGPYESYLAERLQTYPGLAATRLFREVAERGYMGSYTSVKTAVRRLRPASAPGFERRFETPPGQQAQVDFAYFQVAFSDEPAAVRIVWLFSLVLGSSRLIWARFVPHQNLETVIRLHVAAFEALGGVPKEILYDRMKTAVIGRDGEGHIVYNRSLIDLARHYGFAPRACRAYRAKTKGKVERPFRYIRQDFFLGRTFKNLEDLNVQLRQWLDTVANPRRHATTNRIVNEAFAEERGHLGTLPLVPYRAVLKLERRVSQDGMVSIGGNLYSVPDTTRKRILEVQALVGEIQIFEDGALIARHPLLDGRHQRRIAEGHRTVMTRPPRHLNPGGEAIGVGRAGDKVARRSLDIYDAVGRGLAHATDRTGAPEGQRP